MSEYRIIKMKELSPMHIGLGREDHDFSSPLLHSDTISSALTAVALKEGMDSSDVEKFMSSFVISSAFPYTKEIFFLPVAKGKLNIEVEGVDEVKVRKKLKKIKYISSSLWQEYSNGTLKIKPSQIHDEYITENNDKVEICKRMVSQRVMIPRSGDNAQPFYYEKTYFDKDCGLYCIVDCEESEFENLLHLMKILGQTGIGSNKSVGSGMFNVDKEQKPIAFSHIDDADSYMLLSLMIPDRNEMEGIDFDSSRYSMILRGGFIAGSSSNRVSHLRKKSIYMLEEGSVLRTKEKPRGCVVNLKPEWNKSEMHDVFRSGRPLAIPIKL